MKTLAKFRLPFTKKHVNQLLKVTYSILVFCKCHFRISFLLPIFNSGKDGPYIKTKSFAVNAKFTLFHCSISAARCRQFMQHSLKVFHRGGEGKDWTHANNQICRTKLLLRIQLHMGIPNYVMLCDDEMWLLDYFEVQKFLSVKHLCPKNSHF